MRLLVPALLALLSLPTTPVLAAADQCAPGSPYARPGGYCEQLAGGSLVDPGGGGSGNCRTFGSLGGGATFCYAGTSEQNGKTYDKYVTTGPLAGSEAVQPGGIYGVVYANPR